MSDIGIRAADAVRKKAKESGLPLWGELRLLGISHNVVYAWGKGSATPGGVILANMLKRGYDINYILLGKENTYVND